MKLLDTDMINYIIANNISLSGDYFVTPDVEQEMSIAEIVLNKKAPPSIKKLTSLGDFDEATYIKNYFDALNNYGKRSFYNMKGFGDVSIIASVKTLVEKRKNQPLTLPIPGLNRKIQIYTCDNNLKKALNKKFSGDIQISAKSDII